MKVTLDILNTSGADLQYDEIKIGEKVYLSSSKSGISDSDWETLERNKIFLKHLLLRHKVVVSPAFKQTRSFKTFVITSILKL